MWGGNQGQGFNNSQGQGFSNQNQGWNTNQGQGFNNGQNQGFSNQNQGWNTNQGQGQGFGGQQGFNYQGQGFNNQNHGWNSNQNQGWNANQGQGQGWNSNQNQGYNNNMGNNQWGSKPFVPNPSWINPNNMNIRPCVFITNCKRCGGTGVIVKRGNQIPCRRCYRKAGICSRCYGTGYDYFKNKPCKHCTGGNWSRHGGRRSSSSSG